MTTQNPFKYFKNSPEIIRLAVMYYIRYPLIFRQVEDILDNAPRSVMFRLFYVVENNQGVFQENFLYD